MKAMQKQNPNEHTTNDLKRLNHSKNSALKPPQSFPWRKNDVAEAYSVSLRTVASWCKGRRIPFLKIGRSVRFNPAAVSVALSQFVVKEVAN